jgi:hypothetical protein
MTLMVTDPFDREQLSVLDQFLFALATEDEGMLGRERRRAITVSRSGALQWRNRDSHSVTATEIPGVQTTSGYGQQRGAVDPWTRPVASGGYEGTIVSCRRR